MTSHGVPLNHSIENNSSHGARLKSKYTQAIIRKREIKEFIPFVMSDHIAP